MIISKAESTTEIESTVDKVHMLYKLHLKAADLLNQKVKLMKYVDISFLIISSLLFLLYNQQILYAIPFYSLLTVIMAVVSYMQFVRHKSKRLVEEHQDSAEKFWDLRRECLNLLGDSLSDDADIMNVNIRFQRIKQNVRSFLTDTPFISPQAYVLSNKSLQF